jgi:tetratricopeptide (TPR) repeat protein
MTSAQIVPIGELLRLAEQNRAAGRLADAEAACRRILEMEPNDAYALHILALISHQSGKLDDAIAYLQRATGIAPKVALFRANLGEMLRLAGRNKEAVAQGRRAVVLEPNYPEALSNLGVALYDLAEYEEAASCQRRAIAVRPDFALAHSALGNALHALKRFDEAIAAYQRAVALAPNFADAWSNLGTTLHHAGCYEEGIVVLRRAIALNPQHANAHSGLGILLLMRGDFGEGWDEYEWRLQSTEVKGPRFPERPWQGESLAARHIYVQAEQGFGDTIQFVRYLPLLRRRAGAVSFRMHQALLGLMRENFPDIALYGDRGTPAPADCECALVSLPRLFRTKLETIPAAASYLRPPAATVARWREQLAAMRGLRVGLVWAGRPEHANDHRRSFDLAALAPVLGVAGVSFVSLQVGPRAADAAKHSAIADLSKKLVDFAETAGAVAALDLVITVDTAVAHLAGALGKPTWVLLPEVTDWRWLIGREDNPWYPTMRLFRPRHGEGRAEVVARIAAELAAVAGGDSTRLAPFREAGERRAALAADIIAAEREASVATQPAPVLSPEQALIAAEQCRRSGRLGEAEDICRKFLAVRPDNAEAWHLLGLIAHQSGKLADAIAHVSRAAALDGGVALYRANLAEMHRLSGRPDLAEAEARRALAINPNYAGALNNLGIALYEQQRYEEALASYDRAIAVEPDFVDALSNRGNALRALKRLDEAERAYREALARNPRFAQGWNNLGTALRELKRLDEAEEAYRKALAENPNDPNTLDNLALALKDLERLDDAAQLLRRAIGVEARDPKLHLHLGSVLVDQAKLDDAAAALGQALALSPDNHDAINLMGRVAFDRGDLDGSLAHYRRALALKPDLADALNNMGNALKELGQLDEARDAYVRSLALDPDNSGVYVNLADAKKFAPGDPYLVAMQKLETQPLSETERMQLDFALGKAYADINDHARSFEHLLRANAGKRAKIAYDEARTFALFDRLAEVFTPALIAAKGCSGDPSRVPIFVIGMPRSGTTLVEQILASHPLVHGAGELKLLNDIVDTVRAADGTPIPYPEFVPAIDAAALHQIGARYVAGLQKLAPEAPRVTDKMPSNFFFAGLIHLALPDAPIIHTVRDPVDTCLSCFSKLFSAEQNHTYDLAELGRYHRRYQLPAPDGALAPRVAAGAHSRRALRGRGGRPRRPGAPRPRPLRARLGSALPRVPSNRTPGAYRQRHAGAPTDLPKRGRPLAGLRALAWSAACGAWRAHRVSSAKRSVRIKQIQTDAHASSALSASTRLRIYANVLRATAPRSAASGMVISKSSVRSGGPCA